MFSFLILFFFFFLETDHNDRGDIKKKKDGKNEPQKLKEKGKKKKLNKFELRENCTPRKNIFVQEKFF